MTHRLAIVAQKGGVGKGREQNKLEPEIRAEAFMSAKTAMKDVENFDFYIFDGAALFCGNPRGSPVLRYGGDSNQRELTICSPQWSLRSIY